MAPRIPQPFIDELLRRVDIVDIIDSRVPLKSAGRGEYKACCPFHEEKTPSFTVSTDKQFYHCFGCGEHGTAVGFLMNYAHLSFVEAIEELAAHVGIDVPYEQQSFDPKPSDSDNLLESLDKANQFYKKQLRNDTPLAKQTIEYLKNRGLSGETARNFEIGLAPDSWDELANELGKDEATLKKLEKAGLVNQRDSGGYYDRFRGRVMFPIHDFKGRVVAFGGRVLDDGEPKYLNSPETPIFHKGSELYGLFRSRGEIKKAGFALVVEGYMDVIALAQFEINNAVATLGTATTRAHLDRLFRYTDEIVFCFDGDRAGERAAWRALENVLPVIKAGRQVKFLFLPQGHDPDSLVQEKGNQGFQNLVQTATPLSEFLLNHLEQQTDLSHLEGRARLLSLAKPYLDKLIEGPLKQLLIEQLANMAKTDVSTAQAQLQADRNPARRNLKGKSPVRNSNPDSLSLMAKAISLLIQYPSLNQACASEIKTLEGLDLRGTSLLVEISELLTVNPGLKTAVILEHYRDTSQHTALEKLAMQTHLLSSANNANTDQLAAEFKDILRNLDRQRFDLQRDQVLKDQQSGKIGQKEAANLLITIENQRRKNSDI